MVGLLLGGMAQELPAVPVRMEEATGDAGTSSFLPTWG